MSLRCTAHQSALVKRLFLPFLEPYRKAISESRPIIASRCQMASWTAEADSITAEDVSASCDAGICTTLS